MTGGYQPFAISEFKTGVTTYLEPWIRPLDAFEPLVNAYIYRGTVNKRNGSSQFGNTVPVPNPIMGIMKWVNDKTGFEILVVATTVNLYKYDAGTNTFVVVNAPPTFTGNNSQFFNFTNWQPSETADSLLWMVNNKDPVTTYDGVTNTAAQPTLEIDAAHHKIIAALDVQVYQQRLLLIAPTLSNNGFQGQSIYWSATNDPTNWLIDTPGKGGFANAPTNDLIQATELVRDQLIVFFTNSTWIFRFTGNQNNPFIWQRLNNSKSTNSPYASVDYDERATSVGKTGLIACDGVNVQRYDIPIIDYFQNNFSQKFIAQAFSERYDNLNQSWTLYVSSSNLTVPAGLVAPASDQALIYNFLEDSWATYTFTNKLTCLGKFSKQHGNTWASMTQPWEDTDQPWNSFYEQETSPVLLAGDLFGNVIVIDDGNAVVDFIPSATATIIPDIVTTRWNPFVKNGQKVQFGYIDIYYLIASNPQTTVAVTLNFYIDDSENIATTQTFTLDGPTDSAFAWKRVFINLVGEFIQMEIDPDKNSFMQFLGFILWARPAGRLTP